MRLTEMNENKTAHFYPQCFDNCGGIGYSRKCDSCDLLDRVCDKLGEYEDLEEQGKLIKLPCAVDSEVWYIDKYADLYTEIVRGVVDGYLWYRTCGFALNIVWDKPIMGHFGYKRKEMPFLEIGKTVFLNKSAAEAKLKEMSE